MCIPEPAQINYFYNSCKAYGVKAIQMDFMDYQSDGPFSKNSRSVMESRLLNGIAGDSFEWVFTHTTDPNGEYGRHDNHFEVADITTSLVSKGVLGQGMEKLAYFYYCPIYGGNGRATVANIGADYFLQLTYGELQTKCEWCIRVPDPGNLESIGFPCPNPESFKGARLNLPEPFIAK